MKHCTSQLVCWMAAIGVVVVLAGMTVSAGAPRRGETKPLVTVVEAPGDYTELSWAAQPVPMQRSIDRGTAERVAGMDRTETAAYIFAGLLSDPSWRAQYDSLFRDFMLWGHKREEAAVMADAMAAERAVAFADALLRAAGE